MKIPLICFNRTHSYGLFLGLFFLLGLGSVWGQQVDWSFNLPEAQVFQPGARLAVDQDQRTYTLLWDRDSLQLGNYWMQPEHASLLRLDAQGAVDTLITLGKGFSPRDLAVRADGDLYILGGYSSKDFVFAGDSVRGATYTGAFVARISPTGTQRWLTKIEGSAQTDLLQLEVGPQGNPYAIGIFKGDLSVGETVLPGYFCGSRMALVVKLDEDGNGVWAAAPDRDDDSGSSYGGLDFDPQGNLYLTGRYNGNFMLDSISLPSTKGIFGQPTNFMLLKLNPQGFPVWAVTSVPQQNAYAIGEDLSVNQNELIVVGEKDGTFQLDANHTYPDPSLFDDDLFVLKYDLSGNRLWEKIVTGTDRVRANNIQLSDRGEAYLQGIYFESLDVGTPSLALSSPDDHIKSFLVKLDSGGVAQWVQNWDNGYNTGPIDLEMTESGLGYLSGSYSGDSLQVGTMSLVGESFLFIYRFTDTTFRFFTQNTALSEEDWLRDLARFKVFPNPSGGKFSIQSQTNGDPIRKIKVFNSMGQTVYPPAMNVPGSHHHWEIELSDLSPGYYFLQINEGVPRKIQIR